MYKRLNNSIKTEKDLRKVIFQAYKEKETKFLLIFTEFKILSSYLEKGRLIPENLVLIVPDKTVSFWENLK